MEHVAEKKQTRTNGRTISIQKIHWKTNKTNKKTVKPHFTDT